MSDNVSPDLVDWFHAFAKRSVEQLAQLADEEHRSRFRQYVVESLPGHSPPDSLSPDVFAQSVVALRDNERKWNQALMAALTDADDLHRSGATQECVEILRAFAESCPWRRFAEVARRQAAAY